MNASVVPAGSGPLELAALGASLAAAYVLLVPVATLVHELGHAAAALATTRGRVAVRIGVNRRRGVDAGRFGLRFDPRGWHDGWPGYFTYDDPPEERLARAVVHLAGPAATAVVLVVLLAAVAATGGALEFALTGLFWYNAFQFVATAVPVTYPEWGPFRPYAGLESDGRRALDALRG